MGLLGPGRPSMVEGGLPRGGGGGESPSPVVAVDEARRRRRERRKLQLRQEPAELSMGSAARMPSVPSKPWPPGSAARLPSTRPAPPAPGPVYRQKTTRYPGPDDMNNNIVVHGISLMSSRPWPPTRP